MFCTYNFPVSYPKSKNFQVFANGVEIPVIHNIAADFICVEFDEAVEFEVVVTEQGMIPIIKTEGLGVKPKSRGISHIIKGNRISFTMNQPKNVMLEVPGFKQLFLFCNPPETDIPDPKDPSVLYYPAGQIYEVGELWLKEGQTLYIEGGAVLKGAIHATKANNLTIRGRGILDCDYFNGQHVRQILLEQCDDLVVKDIVLVNPQTWMLVLGACNRVLVQNLHELGYVSTSDGIDVCGCKDVLIDDCVIYNNDDCIVIKSLNLKEMLLDNIRDVENIVAQRCVLGGIGGNAIEIGHELITDHVRNIVFRDCDILHAHGTATAISIQNTDRAVVEDVLYEDIRIEHCYNRCLNVLVMDSRYSTDKENKGKIRNVTFKDINWYQTKFNAGYTISVIGGFSEEADVKGVTFDNFCIDGKPIKSLVELQAYYRFASDIVFK